MNGYLNDRRHTFSVANKNLYIFFLQIYFICLPLNAVTLGTMGSALKYIAILPIGISVISMTVFRLNSIITAQFRFVLLAAISCLWSVNGSMSMDRAVSYVLLTALMFSGTAFRFNNKDISKIKRAFLWSSRSTALIMLIFSEYSGGRFVLGGNINEDPNYLCGYLFAGIIISLQGILSQRKKAFYIFELFLYLVLVLQTGSRGGGLAVAASIVCYILVYKKATSTETLKKILYIFSIAAVLLVVLQFLPEELRTRFDYKDAIASGGTGRFQIWLKGIVLYKNLSFHQKILGTGTGTITEVLVMTIYGTRKGVAMHNIFLETLIELGLVGVIVYGISILKFAGGAYKEKDKYAFAVIIGMIVLSLSTSLHTFKPYYNIMLMILILKNRTEMIAKDQ